MFALIIRLVHIHHESKIIYFENQGKKWVNCISKKREIYPKNLYL